MMDRLAESIREGEQTAKERHQAEVEMEQALIVQQQSLQIGGGSSFPEQADMGDNAHDDGTSVIRAGAVEEFDDAPPNTGPGMHVELAPGERTFEGDGPHPLSEQ